MQASTPSVRFGAFELDVHAGELYKNGQRLKLYGKPLQVLSILVEHPQTLVTREHLRTQLWAADTFVDFEHGLNTAVKRLRQALDDDVDAPRYIETLPRRGYRFIGELAEEKVVVLAPPPAQIPLPVPSAQPHKRILRGRALRLGLGATIAFLVVGLVFNVGGLRTRVLHGSSTSPISSIAVLPLANFSGDPDQEYFAEGMTEALITDLAKSTGLRVVSRTSVMQYNGSKKPLPEIARELKVDAVVEGSVQRTGSRVRITAVLIRAATDQSLWADTYEREFQDIFALQSEVAHAITRHVESRVSPQGHARGLSSRPVNPQAYEAYLRGRYHATHFTRVPLLKARQYLQQAIEKDPSYGPSYAELAHVYFKLAIASSPEQSASSSAGATEMLELASATAHKALELDPTLAQAHTMVGAARIYKEADISAGTRELESAVVIAPDSPDALIHAALWRALQGQAAEARTATEHALELDPLGVEVGTLAGQVFYRLRDFDRAITQLQKTLDVEPNLPRAYSMLFRVYEAKGMDAEAVAAYQKTIELNGGTPREIGAPAEAFAKGGIRGFRLWRLRELEKATKMGFDSPTERARLCALLGDHQRALELLEKSYQQHDYTVYAIKVGYEFDSLRSEPRFQDLLQRMSALH